jgi:hypothetical protein
VEVSLPCRFDTSGVWRKILAGAFGLNALILLGILYSTLVSRHWTTVVALAITEGLTLAFTLLLIRFQTGSVGTLSSDGVVVEPNVLLGIDLPGPRGRYTLDRFSAVRVEFWPGPATADVQGGPNEVIWLEGKTGTPDIAVARTDDGAGRSLGRELGALLRLPVKEVGAPKMIRLC